MMDQCYKKKTPERRADRFLHSNQVKQKRSPGFKCGMKVRRRVIPNSRTQLIMALIPPYDSGLSSSDNDEAVILERSNEPVTKSCKLVSVPSNDLQTTLSDVCNEISSSELPSTSMGDERNLYSTLSVQDNRTDKCEEMTDIFEGNAFSAESFSSIGTIDLSNITLSPINITESLLVNDLPVTQNLLPPENMASNALSSSLTCINNISHESVTQVNQSTPSRIKSSINKKKKSPKITNLSQTMKSKTKTIIKSKRAQGKTISKNKKQISQSKRYCERYKWGKGPFIHVVTETEFNEVKNSSVAKVRQPVHYFTDLFSKDIWDIILKETIRYSITRRGNALDITKTDLQNFLGIEILMGIVKMPNRTDYWSDEFRYSKIADTMPLKKYQQIRRNIHFVDNDLQDDDRYFKIRPIVDIVRKNFLTIEEEDKYSIDEMIIPYKGTRAGSRRQYIKNKPKKWGFKVFVRSGTSGIIYDFLLYGGENTFHQHSFSTAEENLGVGGRVVIALCKSIGKKPCSFVFFDNYFTSLELLILLREKYGIFSMGTIRNDRLRGCPVGDDKTLCKRGRGFYDMRVDNTNKVCVVKWIDNKTVCLASTFCEVEPLGRIQRLEPKDKKRKSSTTAQNVRRPRCKVQVPCPDIVKKYNAFMGGVDLVNMLIALYRTPNRSHRWYLAIFYQILDMCICNAWLLYRRDCKKCNTKSMTLKKFRSSIAENLLSQGRKFQVNQPRTNPGSKRSRKHVDEELRFDCINHFPQPCEKGRCANCTKGQTRMECIKCEKRLCHTKERNCFYDYHHK